VDWEAVRLIVIDPLSWHDRLRVKRHCQICQKAIMFSTQLACVDHSVRRSDHLIRHRITEFGGLYIYISLLHNDLRLKRTGVDCTGPQVSDPPGVLPCQHSADLSALAPVVLSVAVIDPIRCPAIIRPPHHRMPIWPIVGAVGRAVLHRFLCSQPCGYMTNLQPKDNSTKLN
jgi:hypothetical protein